MKYLSNNLDAVKVYDTKVILHKDGTLIEKKYEKKLTRKKNGYEEIFSKKENIIGRVSSNQNNEYKVIRSDSLARSRDLLIDYALNNDFYSFITLTFANNVTDYREAHKKYNIYVKALQRKYPKVKILGVPEFQKRGAIHYHILTDIRCGDELIPKREKLSLYNKKTKTRKVIEYYKLKYWNYGYSSAFDLTETDENFNVALYMIKYMFKDIDNRLWGRNKILHTNNLEKSKPIYINSDIDKKALQVIDYIKEKGTFQDCKEILANPLRPFGISQLIYTYNVQEDYTKMIEDMQYIHNL